MDDMVLSWFTSDLVKPPAELRPLPSLLLMPTPADVDRMTSWLHRDRLDDKLAVTVMANPDHRDQLDGLLRKAEGAVTRRHGPSRTRRWQLVTSGHIPHGKVIAWLRHPNGKPADEFPPLNIVAARGRGSP